MVLAKMDTNNYREDFDKKCPVCVKKPLEKINQVCTDYITDDIFSIYKCPYCGSHITKGLAEEKESKYYSNVYYNSKQGKFSPLIENLFRWNHKKNARLLFKRFNPRTILEVGCGRAYILQELRRLGADVYCLESANAAEWILRNKTVNVISLNKEQENDWPFSSDFFDLIIYWHVFEHLSDPIKSLEQATKILGNNKILCISVPNVASLQARLGLATWFHLDVPRHLFHFSQKGLIELLERNNYEIINVSSGDAMQNLFGWFQSLANLFTPKNTNTFYRFLQGGESLKNVSKASLLIQMLTAIVWIPIGLLGFIIEKVMGNHGTMTIYARKSNS